MCLPVSRAYKSSSWLAACQVFLGIGQASKPLSGNQQQQQQQITEITNKN